MKDAINTLVIPYLNFDDDLMFRKYVHPISAQLIARKPRVFALEYRYVECQWYNKLSIVSINCFHCVLRPSGY